MKNKEEEVIKDFDDIFKYIGGWGPFQVRNCSENQLVLKTAIFYAVPDYLGLSVVPKTIDNFFFC